MAVEDALVLAESLDAALSLPAALEAWEARRRPRAMWVQAMSRAVLRQEMGAATTVEEDALLEVGIPGAADVLAKPYQGHGKAASSGLSTVRGRCSEPLSVGGDRFVLVPPKRRGHPL